MKKTTFLIYFFMMFSIVLEAENSIKGKMRQQNRFQTMSTDELLEKRANAVSQKERDELLNELRNRQQTMRKDQFEKLMNNRELNGQNYGFDAPYHEGIENSGSGRMHNYGAGGMGGRGGGRGR